MEVPQSHCENFVHFDELSPTLNFAHLCKYCDYPNIVAAAETVKGNHSRNHHSEQEVEYPRRYTHFAELEVACVLHRSSGSACVMASPCQDLKVGQYRMKSCLNLGAVGTNSGVLRQAPNYGLDMARCFQELKVSYCCMKNYRLGLGIVEAEFGI